MPAEYPGLFAYSVVGLYAYDPDNGYLFVVGSPATNLSLTGLLGPGEYELIAFSVAGNEQPLTTNESMNTSFDVSLQVSSVPEPGSLVLLCSGLLSLGGLGWLKKQQSRIIAA